MAPCAHSTRPKKKGIPIEVDGIRRVVRNARPAAAISHTRTASVNQDTIASNMLDVI